MTTYTPTNGLAGHTRDGKGACPQCNSSLMRTWRRPIDRFSSRFVPVHRYRCESFTCQWEGNFRISREATAGGESDPRDTDAAGFGLVEGDRPPSVPKSFVVHMALAAAGALFVVVVSTTDWWPGHEQLADSDLRDEQWLASANLMVRGTPTAPPRQAVVAQSVAMTSGIK